MEQSSPVNREGTRQATASPASADMVPRCPGAQVPRQVSGSTGRLISSPRHQGMIDNDGHVDEMGLLSGIDSICGVSLMHISSR